MFKYIFTYCKNVIVVCMKYSIQVVGCQNDCVYLYDMKSANYVLPYYGFTSFTGAFDGQLNIFHPLHPEQISWWLRANINMYQ